MYRALLYLDGDSRGSSRTCRSAGLRYLARSSLGNSARETSSSSPLSSARCSSTCVIIHADNISRCKVPPAGRALQDPMGYILSLLEPLKRLPQDYWEQTHTHHREIFQSSWMFALLPPPLFHDLHRLFVGYFGRANSTRMQLGPLQCLLPVSPNKWLESDKNRFHRVSLWKDKKRRFEKCM